RDVRSAVLSTGGAVALCSLTTVIGYSSLLLAKNRALFYFGVVAVIGELACLVTAVIALPALLSWVRSARARRLRGYCVGGSVGGVRPGRTGSVHELVDRQAHQRPLAPERSAVAQQPGPPARAVRRRRESACAPAAGLRAARCRAAGRRRRGARGLALRAD